MKLIAVIILMMTSQASADTCPQFAGAWAGTCGAYLMRIHLMQEGCDKFIVNEYEPKEDGSLGPGSRFYTLNQATLYKTKFANGNVGKAYRRAEIDSSLRKLTLHETHMWESGPPVEVRRATYSFATDMTTIDSTSENFSLTGEVMSVSKSCTGLQKIL